MDGVPSRRELAFSMLSNASLRQLRLYKHTGLLGQLEAIGGLTLDVPDPIPLSELGGILNAQNFTQLVKRDSKVARQVISDMADLIDWDDEEFLAFILGIAPGGLDNFFATTLVRAKA